MRDRSDNLLDHEQMLYHEAAKNEARIFILYILSKLYTMCITVRYTCITILRMWRNSLNPLHSYENQALRIPADDEQLVISSVYY